MFEDVKDLMDEFSKNQIGPIHDRLEEHDELLNDQPATRKKLSSIADYLFKIEERFDQLERLVQTCVENVKELKGKLFKVYLFTRLKKKVTFAV